MLCSYTCWWRWTFRDIKKSRQTWKRFGSSHDLILWRTLCKPVLARSDRLSLALQQHYFVLFRAVWVLTSHPDRRHFFVLNLQYIYQRTTAELPSTHDTLLHRVFSHCKNIIFTVMVECWGQNVLLNQQIRMIWPDSLFPITKWERFLQRQVPLYSHHWAYQLVVSQF